MKGSNSDGDVAECARRPVPPNSRSLAEQQIESIPGAVKRSSWDPGGADLSPGLAGKVKMDAGIRLSGANTTEEVDTESLAAVAKLLSGRQPAETWLIFGNETLLILRSLRGGS